MKNQKGIALTSVIIYVIVMLVAISIISIISSFFYNNVDKVGENVEPSQEFTRFSRFFAEDVNKENTEVLECGENGDYIVLSHDAQYTFKDNKIYRNKVLICQNIYSMKFHYMEGSEDKKGTIDVNYKFKEDSEEKNK